MAQIATKYAAKKFLSKQMNKNAGKEPTTDGYDPYFAWIDHPRKRGKKKKVKKQIPDYIPEHDAIILAKVRQRAYWLDNGLFNFLGIRFGWSAVIGLIPGFGDVADTLLAVLVMVKCWQVQGGMKGYRTRMILNIMIDFLVGLVPIVGDLFDASFRANSRNVRLLEKALDKRYKPEALREEDAKKGKLPATVFEDFSDEEERLPTHRNDTGPRRPEPARVPTETRGGERPERKQSLLKKHSRRERRADVEMAETGRSRR